MQLFGFIIRVKYTCIIFYFILKSRVGSPTLVVYRQKHVAGI